jgi:uncharacterized protein (TIGR00290 family)
MRTKVIVSWSSGKDSALTLNALHRSPEYEVVGLLTTMVNADRSVSMHGVPERLLDQQAASLGLPLVKVLIEPNAPNEHYEAQMRMALGGFKDSGVSHVAIGDIYLQDLRRYREEKLALMDMHGVFPLWKKDTHELARAFLEQGLKAVVTCVDTQLLDGRFAGRFYDQAFLDELPREADPCGENGEFHSFVFGGPGFRQEVAFSIGKMMMRDGRFRSVDLIPASRSREP